MRYFFKDTLQLDPDQLSIYDALTTAVWIFKPLFGFISDSFPINGSKRKSYLILMSITQAVAWIVLGLFANTFWSVITCQIVVNACSGFINVIGEAIMCEVSNEDQIAKKVVSQYLTITAVSMLCSSYISGYLLEYFTPRQIFLGSSLFPVLPLIASF